MFPLSTLRTLPPVYLTLSFATLLVFYLASFPLVLGLQAEWWVGAVLLTAIVATRAVFWYGAWRKRASLACWVVAHTLETAFLLLLTMAFRAHATSDASWQFWASIAAFFGSAICAFRLWHNGGGYVEHLRAKALERAHDKRLNHILRSMTKAAP